MTTTPVRRAHVTYAGTTDTARDQVFLYTMLAGVFGVLLFLLFVFMFLCWLKQRKRNRGTYLLFLNAHTRTCNSFDVTRVAFVEIVDAVVVVVDCGSYAAKSIQFDKPDANGLYANSFLLTDLTHQQQLQQQQQQDANGRHHGDSLLTSLPHPPQRLNANVRSPVNELDDARFQNGGMAHVYPCSTRATRRAARERWSLPQTRRESASFAAADPQLPSSTDPTKPSKSESQR